MDSATIVSNTGLVAMLVAGAAIDLRTRRIPNILTFGGALIGLAANLAFRHEAGGVASLEGWAIGVALLAIPMANGLVGGGDVKLLAAAGAWGGPTIVLTVALYSAVAGCFVTIGFLIADRGLAGLLHPVTLWVRLQLSLLFALDSRFLPTPSPGGSTTNATVAQTGPRARLYLPFGPALAIGGIAAIFLT